MGGVSISNEEVLQLIYDYCSGRGYSNSLIALQRESNVPYRVVPPSFSLERVKSLVRSGDWGVLLSDVLDTLSIPMPVLFDLHECILIELMDLYGTGGAARTFLHNSPVFLDMQIHEPIRYENLSTTQRRERASTEAINVRREAIAEKLVQSLQFRAVEVHSDRKHALIARLLVNNRSVGAADVVPNVLAAPESCVERMHLPEGARVSVVKLWDAAVDYCIVLVGCCNGTISSFRVWPSKPIEVCGHMGVPQQDNSVTTIGTSINERQSNVVLHTKRERGETNPNLPQLCQWIVCGYRDGTLKVYDVDSRKLVRKIVTGQTSSILSVSFLSRQFGELASNSALVVSGSDDGSVVVSSVEMGKAVWSKSNVHATNLTCLRLVEWSQMLISGCVSGEIQLWRVVEAPSIQFISDNTFVLPQYEDRPLPAMLLELLPSPSVNFVVSSHIDLIFFCSSSPAGILMKLQLGIPHGVTSRTIHHLNVISTPSEGIVLLATFFNGHVAIIDCVKGVRLSVVQTVGDLLTSSPGAVGAFGYFGAAVGRCAHKSWIAWRTGLSNVSLLSV